MMNLFWLLAGFVYYMAPIIVLGVATALFGVKGFFGSLLLFGAWGSYARKVAREQKDKK